MNIQHSVSVGGELKACVAVQPLIESVQILLVRCLKNSCPHSCELPTEDRTGSNPIWFEDELPRQRIEAIVSKLLKIDGHAMNMFMRSAAVLKYVPLLNPNELLVGSGKLDVSEYREMSQLASDLIRPMMLRTPDLSQLRPFQVRGVEWLIQNTKGILADDMGLGKTVEAISALRLLFNSGEIGNALIICPKSLTSNWAREFTRWAPELSRLVVSPSGSIREHVWRTVLGKVHVIITNYEQMRTPPSDLLDKGIDIIIADEAHRMRNIGSRVASGVRKLKWRRFWALTGTPIERDPTDLATLLSTIEPSRFSVSDKSLHPTSLRAQARPYILRRLKSEVLDELPEVIEQVQSIELLPGQSNSYRLVQEKLRAAEDTNFLAIIGELRGICDFDEETGESAKADRILEILLNIKAAGEKAVVFSYLLKPLDILQERLHENMGPQSSVALRGSMDSRERDESLRAFKSDPAITVLLCSSRVGGEGLTLVEANHVIFFNEWWNPSANAQARDRVIRIGQIRGVHVYRFRCQGTIEESLDEILERKSGTMSELIDRIAESAPTPDVIKDLVKKLRIKL